MKKHYFATCPKLLAIVVFPPTLGFVLISLFGLLLNYEQVYTYMAFAVVMCPLVLFLPHYLIYRKAFRLFYIDQYGIHNKHVSYNWEDIVEYKICTIQPYKGRIARQIDITVFGIGGNNSDDFIFSSSEKCLFLSLNDKRVKIIREYCGSQNKALEDMISYYTFYKNRR